MTLMTVTMPTELTTRIVASWNVDVTLKPLLEDLQSGKNGKKHYTWTTRQLLRKNKTVVGKDDQLRPDLLAYFHSSGNEGGNQTICERMHHFSEIQTRFGYLFLSEYGKVSLWISLRLFQGLRQQCDISYLFVVVDRLTKYAHFIPLAHPFTTIQVAQVFLGTVYKLHGLQNTMVSDRDKVFLSNFWKELFKLLQVKLLMSTSYHPQTDGERQRSQNRMKQHAHKNRSDRVLNVNDWSVCEDWTSCLQIGIACHTHNVFHVSQLNLSKGTPKHTQVLDLPSCNKEGLLKVESIALLDRKMVKTKNARVVYGLVQWENGTKEDATWELLEELYEKFPTFAAHS
ncbi:reverse transcriptase [Tanacetum coccineum]|uniref:Reverse transcriptase n=1 Tax=Tanacetum coccineum TaxID=301880 RepID=A0ABQ5FP97_9ASTR